VLADNIAEKWRQMYTGHLCRIFDRLVGVRIVCVCNLRDNWLNWTNV